MLDVLIRSYYKGADKIMKLKFKFIAFGILSIALLIVLSSQLKREAPAIDSIVQPAIDTVDEVNPSADSGDEAEQKEVGIQTNEPTATPTDNIAAQTDQPVQNLQPEVSKPAEPIESKKTDKIQKPNGENADYVKVVDHDSEKKPDTTQTGEPQGGERKDGKVYLPGFGWVTETGGSGTKVDGEGDINKQVGTMD
ncbi:MAG: DUF6550 family protein [Bacillota bacterium]